ncbi:GTPase IMAP family member 8-like [Sardina pilchardus]|uniref:GTPase IMAP family member 8-like n=1 Tax=Sardina pilchardus TaxID=27697 RepID=UPI002E0FE85E
METELRIVIIGARWSGKSSTGNTIMGGPRFECGRDRTLQCEDRSGIVSGRHLTVVDVPGWNYFSIMETSEACKQNFKLSLTKCLPGPHVFLLVIPLDMAFNKEQGQYVQEYLSLLGNHVWRHVVVVFTCWDYLGKETTINDHIESEGEALKKVLEKCGNRFQVFDNKNSTNPGQLPELLSKIEELVKMNAGGFYRADEKILQAITEKRKLAAERASQRKMESKKQRETQRQLLGEFEKEQPIAELRVVVLGSRNVGKSSTLNTIFGEKVHESGKRTTSSMMHAGYMDQTLIKVVDTPGWWRSFNVKDTTEHLKQEVMRSVFLCRPGPHVFLLVIDADASFTEKQLEAVESHLQLLGDLWRHVIVVFSRGDCLREETIEEHIEVEGAALTALVNKCGNRYHVLRNRSMDDGTQVKELLEKMKELVAVNHQAFFRCDENVFKVIEEKQSLVRKNSRKKTEEIQTQRAKVTWTPLSEIRVVLLGQKTVGKTASGNTILGHGCLPTCFNTNTNSATADVADKKIVVVDTLGWSQNRDSCTIEEDKEIVRGLTLCPPGPHAFLLILPVDMAFTRQQQRALENHMILFGEDIWKYTVVVFTYGDQLGDQTIEEHIMMEGRALQRLVERCGNRYHVLNNKNKSESNQVPELLEKIEEMVAINEGKHYIPNMTEINQRVEEKFEKREISVCLEEKWKTREAEMIVEFRDYLSELLTDLRGQQGPGLHTSDMSLQLKPAKQDGWKKPRTVVSLIKQSKRTEQVEKKICEKINSMETDLKKANGPVFKRRTSIDYLWPSMSGSNRTLPEPSPRPRPKGKFKEVLAWLSTMKIEREDPPTLYSQASSGYRSNLSDIFSIREGHDAQKS